MRSATVLVSLFVASVGVAAVQVACTTDVSAITGTGSGTPDAASTFDAGHFLFPDAGVGTQIVIQGTGTVFGGSTEEPDGATVDAINCTTVGGTGSAKATGTCFAPQQSTLYVTSPTGWTFSEWAPSGSSSSTFYVDESTPASITAIFIADGANVPDANLPTGDANGGGVDSNLPGQPDAADAASDDGG
jgi:hypothetical protein